jgi:hypothetical protein
MQRRHTACQWNGQAARLIHNKCRGRVALRPYVRLHSWAYITCNRPRGSIGSPPERGAGVYADRSGSGHVSAPNLRLGLVPGPSMFCPGTLGPHCGRSGPPTGGGGGPDPILGVRLAHVEVLDHPWRSELFIQGSGALPWGSGLTVDALEYITFSGHVAALDPPMWWIRALLWTQSSRPRLGRVVAWSHTQHLYHATKR